MIVLICRSGVILMRELHYNMLDNDQLKLVDRLYDYDETLVYATMGCVDSETEYLTPDGWVKISNYKAGVVGQYDKYTGHVNFVKPNQYIKKPCNYFYHLRTTRGVDQMLSGEHSVLLKSKTNGATEVVSADKLYRRLNGLDEVRRYSGEIGNQSAAIPVTFTCSTGSGLDLNDAQIRVMVMVKADGHLSSANLCTVRLKKSRKIERCRILLKNAKIDFKERLDTSKTGSGFIVFTFVPPERNKTYDKKWWDSTELQRSIIISEVLMWDGCTLNNRMSFFSNSKPCIDFIQYCFVTRGYKACIKSTERTRVGFKTSIEHVLTITKRGLLAGIYNQNTAKKNMALVQNVGDGFKYCFSVPSGFLVLRRNGKIFCTGNSGKTACYLTAINELLRDNVVKRALIVAPLNPAKHVWSKEHMQWSHLERLDVKLAIGTPEQRTRAIESYAAIVVINIENLVWFLDKYKNRIPFDALCIDETSKFGSTGNKSVKKLRHATKAFKHCVGLTGTPVHEGFEKLFSQVLVLDGGKRLGTSKQKFLEKHFYATDYEQHNWDLRAGEDTKLLKRLNDLIYAMPSYTHNLPALVENNIVVPLHDDVMYKYKKLAKDNILVLDDGTEILAESAAVLSGKLEQFANGFLYEQSQGETITHFIHDAKIGAFINYITGNTKQTLVFYQFQADKYSLCKTMDSINVSYSTMDDKTGMQKFLDNKVQVLLLHPKSAGHGLNLHTGGACDILCYTPIWSNDQEKQLIGRLWRRGAMSTVTVSRLVSQGTIDETKLARVASKDDFDELFKAHIKSL